MHSRSLAVLAAVTMAMPAATSASAAPGSSEPERCRDVVIRNGLGDVYTQTRGLWAIRTTCATARMVSRRYFKRREGTAHPARRILGFRCDGGDDGVSCRKGQRIVTWGYYDD